MSGVFHGKGYCQLRDIFGFFSFPCGSPQFKIVKVRSAPCFGEKPLINAQTGAEDQRNKPAADIERYYMREYTPGDRLRDINWKSSEKIDTLITRISTENQEKTSRIEVHFRNYGHVNGSLQALWLLDRAKARLAFFLRNAMEQNSLLIIDVRAANGSWEIKDQDDLEKFLDELAGISFFPPQHEITVHADVGTGELYVFSTACDIGLPDFIFARNTKPISLFLVQPGFFSADKTVLPAKETEILKIRDFIFKGCIPSYKWFMEKKTKPIGIQTNKTEMFYAEIKL